jgi:hypothetical protein
MEKSVRQLSSRATVVILTVIGLIGSLVTIWEFWHRDQPTVGPFEDTLSKVRRERHLKVGYIPYYDITSREVGSGRVKGYLIDVTYKIASDLGLTESDIE